MIKKVYYKDQQLDFIYSQEDEEFVKSKNIRVSDSRVNKERPYFLCTIWDDKEKKSKIYSRYILNLNDPELYVDHIDGDPLNNQRNNLRIVTHGQNVINKFTEKTNYKFLIDDSRNNLFVANIPENKKSFDNNYDAIIHIYNFIQDNEEYKEYSRDKRTLLDIAEDIPYLSYKNSEKIQCDVCGSFLYSLSKLERHKKENCSLKECRYCGEQFLNRSLLSKHKCKIKCTFEGCERVYDNPNSMRKHLVEKHHDGDKSVVPKNKNTKTDSSKLLIQCTECDKTYSSIDSMKAHRKKKHS